MKHLPLAGRAAAALQKAGKATLTKSGYGQLFALSSKYGQLLWAPDHYQPAYHIRRGWIKPDSSYSISDKQCTPLASGYTCFVQWQRAIF